MIGLRRFQWKRRRAALALLPAAAMMVAMGLAGAASGTTPSPVLGGPGTGASTSAGPSPSTVKISAKRHVRVGSPTVIRGRVTPAGNRSVVIKVHGKTVKAVHTRDDGSFKARWSAPGAGVYVARAT